MRQTLVALNTQKTFIFLFIITAWFLPAVQDKTGFIKIPDLFGETVTSSAPIYSDSLFTSGKYAEDCEKYYNEKSGLRNWLVRLRNQVHFSVLKTQYTNNVVIGKENYLFGKRFIASAYGEIFNGTDTIEEHARLTAILRDTLAQKGIRLILLIAPGKGFYYPEYIPDSYKKKSNRTNYGFYTEAFKKYGIPMIDFNRYFMNEKKHQPYPLFTKLGTHWSNYGSVLCADSFLKTLNTWWKEPITTFTIDPLEPTHQSRDVDDADLYSSMNLLCKINDKDFTYVYPQLRFHHTRFKPNALFIGDSFYWNWFMMKIPFEVFDPCSNFLYYGEQLYDTDPSAPVSVNEIDLKKEIEKRQLVVFLFSETNFVHYPFGFIQKACQIYQIK